MSKRSLGDDAGDDASETGASKRQKAAPSLPSEKLTLLRDYYKELRALVKAAEDGHLLGTSPVLDRLIDLNEAALPILQSLDAKNQPASTPAPSTHAPDARAQLPVSLIPILSNMHAWTVEDIPSEYPPLPPIPDSALEQIAFTHSGTDQLANYETLEFLGDSFIYHAASEIITQTFPELTPGRKSQIREGLLRNSSLAKYTVHYGIERRANLPSEFTDSSVTGGTKVTLKERQKVHGDLFEAYVGALIRAKYPAGQGPPDYDGVTVALGWLRSLWAMSISRDIERKYSVRHNKQQPSTNLQSPMKLSAQVIVGKVVRESNHSAATSTSLSTGPAQAEPSNTAQASPAARKESAEVKAVANPQKVLPFKVQLSALIGCKEVKIRYEDAPTKKVIRDKHSRMPLFTVAVWVDAWGTSECLGHGSGLSKKDAGEKAAERALESKAKLKFYVAQKAKFYGDRDAPSAQDDSAKQIDGI